MGKLKQVVLYMSIFVICFLLLSGCKKEKANKTPFYHGSAVDLLSENYTMFERLVQLLMDHPDVFLLYDSPYSEHPDFPLWIFDYSDDDRVPCFSTSENDFIMKCKSDLFLNNIALYKARADTYYLTLEFFFLHVDSSPYTIYWIDSPKDGSDKDILKHTLERLLGGHSDSCYIENVSGNNWYMLKSSN